MFDIDRILAIPDESVDYLQMGISGGERAALAARGFVRKDGTKAKDYMIRTIQKTEKNKAKAEKAIIKGDKPLSNTNGTFLSSNPRNAERQDSMRKDMEVLKNTQFKYDQGQKATVVTGSGDRTRKEEVGILDSYVQDGQVRYTVYPKGKKSSVGSHFWVKESDLTPVASTKKQSKAKPQNTPIAPAKKLAITDKKGFQSEGAAAKKIKGAIATTIATPKSRKVVKGTMPVSGRVIEFGKVGKDGFAKVTVTYPVHSTKNKSRSMQSDPQKGEKIGDYFVSGDARSGYGVTHLPSGFQVFSPRSLRDQTGNDNKESAKSTARKLHDAKISLPNTFHKMKNTEPSKYQEFGRKVLNAVNGEGASQQQPERSPNADVKSDRAKPEFTTLAKANQKNVPSAAEQRYASKASKRGSSKGKAPLNLKDSLNQQVIRSTERSNRVKLQGKKVSPQRSLEATKFQVANQALTNISANTKRLRRISTGTAKKRTITDSLGNSFTRKKYRFKDKKQPSAAQKMNMTDAEYAAFKKKVKRL